MDRLNAAADAEERRALILSSKKPGAMVVDLVGVSGQHKLNTSLTTADILGGNYEDAVVDLAKENIKKKGGRSDSDDLAKELRIAKLAVEAAERERRKNVILNVRTTNRIVDPFDLFDMGSAREPGWFKGKKPTEKQIEYLGRQGFSDRQIKTLSFFQSSRLIDKIHERRAKGQCTTKQAQTLIRFGESPESTFEQARSLLDQIKANGWQPLPK